MQSMPDRFYPSKFPYPLTKTSYLQVLPDDNLKILDKLTW
jgi:hypothetical protein